MRELLYPPQGNRVVIRERDGHFRLLLLQADSDVFATPDAGLLLRTITVAFLDRRAALSPIVRLELSGTPYTSIHYVLCTV